MTTEEQYVIDFSIWKDKRFVLQSRSGEYYPTYQALSEYDMEAYSLEQVLKFYKETL